jgi:hypothetical protein
MGCAGSERECKEAVFCITLFKVPNIKLIIFIPILQQRNKCSTRFSCLTFWHRNLTFKL